MAQPFFAFLASHNRFVRITNEEDRCIKLSREKLRNLFCCNGCGKVDKSEMVINFHRWQYNVREILSNYFCDSYRFILQKIFVLSTSGNEKTKQYEEIFMNNHLYKLISCLLMMALLSSCNLVKQTVEVTIPIPKSTISSESGFSITSPDATANPLSIDIQTDLASIPMDPVFFDGLIVLTQYYTLLDLGAYEKAVSLYSISRQEINGEEADIAYFQSSLESIEIRYIYPFDYWLAKQGQVTTPNRQDEMKFVVGTTVVYKGAAWNDGGTPVPYDRTNFILLILENGKWKINEINSSPWFSKR